MRPLHTLRELCRWTVLLRTRLHGQGLRRRWLRGVMRHMCIGLSLLVGPDDVRVLRPHLSPARHHRGPIEDAMPGDSYCISGFQYKQCVDPGNGQAWSGLGRSPATGTMAYASSTGVTMIVPSITHRASTDAAPNPCARREHRSDSRTPVREQCPLCWRLARHFKRPAAARQPISKRTSQGADGDGQSAHALPCRLRTNVPSALTHACA